MQAKATNNTPKVYTPWLITTQLSQIHMPHHLREKANPDRESASAFYFFHAFTSILHDYWHADSTSPKEKKIAMLLLVTMDNEYSIPKCLDFVAIFQRESQGNWWQFLSFFKRKKSPQLKKIANQIWELFNFNNLGILKSDSVKVFMALFPTYHSRFLSAVKRTNLPTPVAKIVQLVPAKTAVSCPIPKQQKASPKLRHHMTSEVRKTLEQIKLVIDQKPKKRAKNNTLTGLYYKAERILQQIIRDEANNLVAYALLIDLYQVKKEREQVLFWLEKALAVAPDYFYFYNEKATFAIKNKDLKTAKECYAKSLSIDPLQTEPRIWLSQYHYKRKDLTLAVGHLQAILTHNPKHLYAHQQLFRLAILMNNCRYAALHLHHIYQQKQGFKQGYLLIYLLLKNGHIQNAKTVFLKEINRRTSTAPFLPVLEELTKRLPNQIARVKFLEQVLVHLQEEQVEYLLCENYLHAKMTTKAHELAINSLTKNPENTKMRLCLAQVYSCIQKANEAYIIVLDVVKTYLEADKPMPDTAILKVLKKFKKNGYSRMATELLLLITKAIPDNMVFKTYLANHHINNRKWKKASTQIEQVLKVEPKNKIGINLTIKHLERQNKFLPREQKLVKLYEENPYSTIALYQLAKSFTRYQKYHIALELIQRAYRNSPMHTDITLFHLNLAGKMGDFETVKDLKKTFAYQQKLEDENFQERYPDYLLRSPVVYRLENLKLKGIYKAATNSVVVEEIDDYFLLEKAVINPSVQDQDVVHFAAYFDEETWDNRANFVEPYYTDLKDIAALLGNNSTENKAYSKSD